jgi:hypothetical protein
MDKDPVSGVSLKEHFEKLLSEQDRRHELGLQAAKDAVAIAEANAEKWRESANEWRGAMNDRERNLMPRAEAEAESKNNAAKVAALTQRMDLMQGRSTGANWLWTVLLGLLGIALSLGAVILMVKH